MSVTTTVVCALMLLALAASLPVSQSKNSAEFAKGLVAEMTLDEKIAMVHGVVGKYIGNTKPVERLGIPALRLNDGPQGFRGIFMLHKGTSTSFPSGLTMAATWDKELVYEWGAAMGEEFIGKGANVLLGPGLNVARVPQNGRNFEYLSGEDPFLGASLVGPAVKGIQDQGVIANAKHFIENNQETHRMTVNAEVDERTRFEIYYPPFQAAIDAGVGSFMCSYNRVNGHYACQNNETLGNDLRNVMGFKGWVMSDWWATHTAHQAALNGLDQEMPLGFHFSEILKMEVMTHLVPVEVLNQKVERILEPMVRMGVFDRNPDLGDTSANVTSDAHNALVRKLAASAAVLVKNDGVLPLPKSGLRRIVVLGDKSTSGGGGSGSVQPPYVISPEQGVSLAVDADTEVVYLDGKDLAKAVSAAYEADAAIVVAGVNSHEGKDRSTLSLGDAQNELIESIAGHQPNTVVVINSPGAVLMPWEEKVKAVVMMFLPGQENGNALADVLFGVVNPSGKLPLTIPNKDNEMNFTSEQYPGVHLDAEYSEHLLVGYRWYSATNTTPKFPFGHGLSYTSFKYDDVSVDSDALVVSLSLQNTGSVAGAEVVQLYVDYPKTAGEPPRQLKAFEKVFLDAGERRTVHLQLNRRLLSVWDVSVHEWAPVPGTFGLNIGSSSQDIRVSALLVVKA